MLEPEWIALRCAHARTPTIVRVGSRQSALSGSKALHQSPLRRYARLLNRSMWQPLPTPACRLFGWPQTLTARLLEAGDGIGREDNHPTAALARYQHNALLRRHGVERFNGQI